MAARSRLEPNRQLVGISSLRIPALRFGDRPPRPFPPAPEVRFAHDSALEGPGFEPSVPRLQVELGASGGARCDDAAPAAPADIAVKGAEIRFPARGVGPG